MENGKNEKYHRYWPLVALFTISLRLLGTQQGCPQCKQSYGSARAEDLVMYHQRRSPIILKGLGVVCAAAAAATRMKPTINCESDGTGFFCLCTWSFIAHLIISL